MPINFTNYPAQIDTAINLPPAVDNFTPVSGAIFNGLRGAIIAIETALGVQPAGVYSSVAGRFTALETTVGNLENIQLAKDLGGTPEQPLVIGIQGRPVSSVAPAPGQVIAWNGIAWVPANVTVGTTIAFSGDLMGNSISQTVIGLQGHSLSAVAPTSGQVLSFNGSQWVPSGFTLTGPAGGDLGGTYPNPTVTGLEGKILPALAPGYLNYTGTAWALTSIPSSLPPNGSAGGDLAGTYPNPTVAKLQGTITLSGSPTSGQILTATSATAASWQAAPISFTAGGDLSGSNTSQTVIHINGASIPAAGALTTGNVLQVTGVSTLSYAPVNLAGGANFVIGTLPPGSGGTGLTSGIPNGVFGTGIDGTATCDGSAIVAGMTSNGTAASVTTVVGSTATITGLLNVNPDIIGKSITISGANSTGNNGTFVVTTWLSTSSVTVTNSSGVSNDAHNGTISWHVLNYYVLTREVIFNSLTINNGVNVNTNGFRVFAQTLHVDGYLHANGYTGFQFGINTSTPTPGGGGFNNSNVTLLGGTYSWAGADSTPSLSVSLGGQGGAGGSAASSPGTVTTPTAGGWATMFSFNNAITMTTYKTGSGGSVSTAFVGGGTGGGIGNNGGSGPDGGSGGGVMVVIAQILSGVGFLTANGGQGGNSTGGGAGGGGGGGVVTLITRFNTFTGTLTANGGSVGTGSGGTQTPLPGGTGTIIQLQA